MLGWKKEPKERTERKKMQSASAAVLNSPASAYVYIPQQRILVEPSSCSSSYAPPLRASKFFEGGARSLGRRQNHPGQRLFPGFRINLLKYSRKLVVKAVAAPHSVIELPLTAENVESVLDAIRPYLIADGGNVALHEIDGNVVKLKLQGACGSCPSSVMTMKMGIEHRLMEKIPEVATVESVPDEETGLELNEENIEKTLGCPSFVFLCGQSLISGS